MVLAYDSYQSLAVSARERVVSRSIVGHRGRLCISDQGFLSYDSSWGYASPEGRVWQRNSQAFSRRCKLSRMSGFRVTAGALAESAYSRLREQ